MYGDINTSNFVTVIKLIMLQCFYDVDVDEGYIVYSTGCTDPIDLIFYRERASQPAKNETKEK
jgi:hypothetical protein